MEFPKFYKQCFVSLKTPKVLILAHDYKAETKEGKDTTLLNNQAKDMASMMSLGL